MLILGLESSAKSASAALCRDGERLACYMQCSGMTHSKTLLPMAEEILKQAGLRLEQVDAVAVARGPGSFTGIRIGVATVKGLCWGADKPAIGVSTLEAMAWNGECAPAGALICCAMDARRSQIYNALFVLEDGALRRLAPDRAIALAALAAELRGQSRPIWVVGDGAVLCHDYLTAAGLPALLAPEAMRLQSAWGVCRAAANAEPQNPGALLPVYLRLSQAERERQARLHQTSSPSAPLPEAEP